MFRDRVEQTTNAAGSGAYTLDGTVVGKRSFAAVFADNDQVIYTVVKDAAWECNLGTLDTGTSPPTLSRDRLIASSTGSAIVWPDSTSKTIFNDVPAEMFGPLGNQLVAATVGGTANAIVLTTKVQTPLYKDGMCIEFEATGTPTGAVTAGANALALKPVLHKSGDQAGATSWEAGAHLRFRFDESLDSWVLMAGHRAGSNAGSDIASAATLVRPANARDGSYHRITGAVTIANLWASAPVGIEHEFLVVTGFTITHSANLLCPGAANIVAAANDRFRVRHVGSNVWLITNYQKADGTAIVAPAAPPQVLAARYYAEYATNADLSTTIPADDTVPTSAEGTQVLSIASVVVSGSQRVRARFMGFGEQATSGSAMTAALFRGTTCIQVSTFDTGAGLYVESRPLPLEIEEAPGAGTYTYSVRVGAAAGITRLNGSGTARLFGGAAKATLAIDVINP